MKKLSTVQNEMKIEESKAKLVEAKTDNLSTTVKFYATITDVIILLQKLYLIKDYCV